MERFCINEVTCTILRIKEDVTLHTYFMASRIEVNGFVSAKSGPCLLARSASQLSHGNVLCARPGLHLVEWTRHSMDCSQIMAGYNACQSGSQVEPSRILVSLEFECFMKTNGNDKIRRYYFLDSFASRYLFF